MSMLPFVKIGWKTSLKGQIPYNRKNPISPEQSSICVPSHMLYPNPLIFLHRYDMYLTYVQHFSCRGPKHISIVIFSISLVCCQLEDKGRTTLHRLLWHKSTKLMLRGGNHPGATEKMHFCISFFKCCIFVSACLYFVFVFIWRTDPPPAQVFAEWWLWQKAGFRSKGFLCLPSTGWWPGNMRKTSHYSWFRIPS